MMEKKKWTDDVYGRMSRYESNDIPQGLWEGIESVLDNKPKARIVPWLRIASVVAAAAVVAVAVIIVAPSGERQDAMLQAVADKSGQSGVNHAANLADNDNPTGNAPQVVAQMMAGVARIAANGGNPVSSAETDVTETPSKTDVMEASSKIDVTETPSKGTASDVPVRKDFTGSNRLLADYSGTPAVSARRKDRGGMSLSMFASNITSSSSSMDGYGVLASMSPMAVRPQGDVSGFDEPAHTVAYNNRYTSSTTKVDHHQPISIGLGVRYFFSDRWALETGVTYSMLESEMESGTEQSYIYNNQKVHYVGVPLSVGYQWIKGKSLSVYTSGGVTAEFGVRGKLETQCFVDGGSIDSNTSDIRNIPVQWSVGVAAGVQYNIFSGIGVYAEPGMVYYIDNGSSLETSYSDKPINFKLKVGLRIDLNR